MSTLDPWEYAARAFEPSPYPTPHDVQATVTPHAAANPAHLRAIDDAMLDVLAGETDMLLVSLAPQEGKSERVIRAGILWWLHHRPGDRVIVASFEKTTAERWGRTARNDIEAHPELGLRLRRDSRAAARWDLAPTPAGDPGGSLFCVGVGGPI